MGIKKKKLVALNKISYFFRIGLAIAKRLAEDGASVMISSRKQANVEEALNYLRRTLPQSARQERVVRSWVL